MAKYDVLIRASMDLKGLDAAERKSKSTFDRISAEAQKAAQRELKAQRDLQRAVEQLQRQRSAALIRAFREEERQEQRSVRERERAFKAAEREKQKAAEQSAQRQAQTIQAATQLMARGYQLLKAAAIATFFAITGAAVGLGLALRSVISEAVAVQNAFKGLESVAAFKGIAGKDAEAAVKNLRFVRGGMISIGDAATSLKNLLSTGFGLKESVDLLEAFSDSAAFGKQAALSYGDAIRSATEGVKNQNSILVDNAGVTKNLSVILKERGFALEDLSDKLKGVAAREALYLGILAETTAQTGDADKVMAGFSGRMSALEQSWRNLKIAVGEYVISIPFVTESFATITAFIDKLTTGFPAFAQMVSSEVTSVFTSLPPSTKAAFEDMLATVETAGGRIVQWFKDNYPLIREAVENVLNQIARFWEKHGEDIKKTVERTMKSIGEALKLGLQILSGDWEAAWKTFHRIVVNEGPRIASAVNLMLELVQSAIKTSGKTIGKIAYALGAAIAEGVWDGIKQSDTATKVKVWAAEIVVAAKQAWVIHSPSQVFFAIGQQIVAGLTLGLRSGQEQVQQTLSDLLDVAANKFTKAPKKPAEAAAKQIADILRKQAEALREIGGKESAVDRVNRLLSDPSVARRIDERTRALVRQAAAMEDALGATRARRVIGDQTRERRVGLDIGGQVRDRRVGEGPNTDVRLRVINPIDLQIAQTYGDIIADLNAELLRHTQLTQVEITLQRLQAAGLDDLTDARAQEALAMADAIDQQEMLNQSREQIRDWAGEISDIFGRAVYYWDFTFKGFFKSIGQGFLDMFKRIFADSVQRTIFKGAENLLTRIFLPNNAATAASSGGFFSNIRNTLTGGFGGGPGGGGLLGGSISVPPSTSATTGAWARLGASLGFPGGSSGPTAAATPAGLGLGSLASSIPFLGAAFGIQSLITSFSGTQSNFEAATGGGFLGFLINRNARRRREEEIRNELSHQTGTAIWALIARAQRGEVTITQARSEWNAIEAAYREGVAQLRDSKTRRHAELQWTNDFAPLWSKVEANARQGEAARAFSSQFVPTFARGGVFGSDFFMPRAARGLMELPGAFDRRDDLLMRVSRGERVAVMTPDQFDRIGGRRTFEAAGVPALATGGSSAPMTSSSDSKGDIVIQTNDGVLADLLRRALRSPEGRRIVVEHVRGDFDAERSDGLMGDIRKGLVGR